MKQVAWLLLVALTLSGCFGGGDDDGPDGTGDGSGTEGDNNGTADLKTFQATLFGDVLLGYAPLPVNFTLTSDLPASDAANATWRLEIHDATAVLNGSVDANATALFSDGGPGLPANSTYTFDTAGNYTAIATVHADGYATQNATVEIEVDEKVEAPPVPAEPVFFDGAENGLDQWTLNVYLYSSTGGQSQEVPMGSQGPGVGWEVSGDDFLEGANSFFSNYPDGYIATMTSMAIEVPAEGNPSLEYWARGGAEENAVDGMDVLVGPTDGELTTTGHFNGADEGWKSHKVSLSKYAGQSIQVQFRFSSDEGCSATYRPVSESTTGVLCGSGDFIGYYVDNIKVQ